MMNEDSDSSNKVVNFVGSRSSNWGGASYDNAKYDQSIHNPFDSCYNDLGGDKSMDLEKYIDRLDQDRQRMENQLREDRQQMERRLTEERRLSEERMEKRSCELEDRLEQRFINIGQRFDRMEQKIDDLSINVYKENKETKRWMMGTFFAVAAMIVATVIGVANIVMSFR